METESAPDQSQSLKISASLSKQQGTPVKVSTEQLVLACIGAVLLPGLGHAILKKWDRALVFFFCIIVLFIFGIQLQGRLFGPDSSDAFAVLKFVADAGSGLLYWLPWMRGIGVGDPSAYTYDFGNVFIYVAGLLNMLVVVDAFDIAMGRKQ